MFRYKVKSGIRQPLRSVTAGRRREPSASKVNRWRSPDDETIFSQLAAFGPVDAADAAAAAGMTFDDINLVSAAREASEMPVRDPNTDKVLSISSDAAGLALAQIGAAPIAGFRVTVEGDCAEVRIAPVEMPAPYQNILSRIDNARGEVTRAMAGDRRQRGFDAVFCSQLNFVARFNNQMAFARREVFGPGEAVIFYHYGRNAVRIANNSGCGLRGVVFTKNLDREYPISGRVRVGNFTQHRLRFDETNALSCFKNSVSNKEVGVPELELFIKNQMIWHRDRGRPVDVAMVV